MHVHGATTNSPSSLSWLVMSRIICALSPSALDKSHRSPAAPREAKPGQDTQEGQSEEYEDIIYRRRRRNFYLRKAYNTSVGRTKDQKAGCKS